MSASKKSKTKVVHYKRCAFHKGKHSLEVLLRSALEKKDTVGLRRQGLGGDDSPVWLVIGQQASDSSFVFGLLVQYSPGTAPSFVVDDVDARSMAVEHIRVGKTRDGKQRELLESMLFFGVTGNHLVMMQSMALRSLQLERHLQWLLHHAGVLEGDNTLVLSDQVPRKVRERIEDHPIKKMVIGGDLAPHAEQPASVLALQDNQTREVTRARSLQVHASAGSPKVMSLLRGLIGTDKSAKLDLDEIDGSNIEYSLEIRYKRTTTEQGQKFMNRLGTALRHAEEVETTIHLVGGGEIKGDELRLTGSVKITTIDGVPNPDEVYEALRTWLLERVKSGEISG